tara:strand:- start:351 stop:728 length:378 start_codon:yes stop_codon:yes gene_type:complete
MASFLKTLQKNKTVKLFNKLCRPAQLYLALSILSVLAIFTQNHSNPYHYCVGFFRANSSCNNKVYFLFKFIYIIFWTFIIQTLCRSGFTTISWLIVLFPFILMFLIIMMLILHLVQVEYKMKNNH